MNFLILFYKTAVGQTVKQIQQVTKSDYGLLAWRMLQCSDLFAPLCQQEALTREDESDFPL